MEIELAIIHFVKQSWHEEGQQQPLCLENGENFQPAPVTSWEW